MAHEPMGRMAETMNAEIENGGKEVAENNPAQFESRTEGASGEPRTPYFTSPLSKQDTNQKTNSADDVTSSTPKMDAVVDTCLQPGQENTKIRAIADAKADDDVANDGDGVELTAEWMDDPTHAAAEKP